MLFSEKYGYEEKKPLLKEEMPDALRVRLWNVFYAAVFRHWELHLSLASHQSDYEFIISLCDRFFIADISTIPRSGVEFVEIIKSRFVQLPWHKIYDFIDFFSMNYQNSATKEKVLSQIDKILEEEKAAHRIVAGKVSPIINKEEIKEIEKAINLTDKFKPVRQHLSKALDKWADRKNPDYENSIKESISALESLVQILDSKKGILGDLIQDLEIHPALKQGFRKLYGWTSAQDSGIRHGEFEEPIECGEPEARYMLISCSAFINYLIGKYEKTT